MPPNTPVPSTVVVPTTNPGLPVLIRPPTDLPTVEETLIGVRLTPEERAQYKKKAEDLTTDIKRFLSMKEECAYEAAARMLELFRDHLYQYLELTPEDRDILREEMNEPDAKEFSWDGYLLCRLNMTRSQAGKYLFVAENVAKEVVAAIGVERANLYWRWLENEGTEPPANPLREKFQTPRGMVPLGKLSYREARTVFRLGTRSRVLTDDELGQVRALGRDALAVGIKGLDLRGQVRKQEVQARIVMPLESFAAIIQQLKELRALREQPPRPAVPDALVAATTEAMTKLVDGLPRVDSKEVQAAHDSLLEKLREAEEAVKKRGEEK